MLWSYPRPAVKAYHTDIYPRVKPWQCTRNLLKAAAALVPILKVKPLQPVRGLLAAWLPSVGLLAFE
ncbi:hypothetical protein Tco_1391297 [Tanacetum coccineum]